MPSTAEQLKVELRKLPVKERAELAHFLIESLDNEEGEAWEVAWEAELNRRIESVENGTAVLEPGDEVLARWREKYPCSGSTSCVKPEKNLKRPPTTTSGNVKG